MAKVNLKKIKSRIIEKIDRKLDPQRKERELFLKRIEGKMQKAGPSNEYLNSTLIKLKNRFYEFNDFFVKGKNISFKMADPKYKQTPKEIIDRRFAKPRDNLDLFDHEILKILKQKDKNDKSKIQQLQGLKYNISRFDELKTKFLSELDKEALNVTDTILSLQMDYKSVKDKIKLDKTVTTTIEKEISAWQVILGNLRAFTRELNARSTDIYLERIDQTINKLSRK